MHIWNTSRTPLLYAHRGARLEYPENSIPSFRRAIEHGADVIETDVHMSLDRRVVITHDPTGYRMAGKNVQINRCSLAEIQSWDIGHGFIDSNRKKPFIGKGINMPSFDEVLAAFPTTPFNVDIKQTHPNMLIPLLEVIDKYQASNRVLLTSFSSSVLDNLRALNYSGPLGMGRLEVALLTLLPQVADRLFRSNGSRAQLPVRYGPINFGRQKIVDQFQRRGIKVDFWVVNQPEQALFLLDQGADGIVTDDPQAMAGIVKKYS